MGRLRQAALMVGSNFRACTAPAFSQLLIASDAAGWVLDEEAKEMIRIARRIGFPAYFAHKPMRRLSQCVHYTSFFSLASPNVFRSRHRISVDYFHGKPEKDPAFAAVFAAIRKHAHKVSRLRLSYSGMLPYAREAGVPEDRVHVIPIGINPSYFRVQSHESRKEARQRLGIPDQAFVVGSFQKDGQGWGDGREPKLIKGPDVFADCMAQLKQKVPELQVLLTGPARGYLKGRLAKAGVPFQHHLLEQYSEVGEYFQALDAYLVSSREEGGPKAVLESMLSGVPLVTTRVGQAIDIVRHEETGLMYEPEDVEGLVKGLLRVREDSRLRRTLVEAGQIEGLRHTYEGQSPLWQKFFEGFVNHV